VFPNRLERRRRVGVLHATDGVGPIDALVNEPAVLDQNDFVSLLAIKGEDVLERAPIARVQDFQANPFSDFADYHLLGPLVKSPRTMSRPPFDKLRTSGENQFS
jgi:hypothetical protein